MEKNYEILYRNAISGIEYVWEICNRTCENARKDGLSLDDSTRESGIFFACNAVRAMLDSQLRLLESAEDLGVQQ